mgnify:CR=1 FL=1
MHDLVGAKPVLSVSRNYPFKENYTHVGAGAVSLWVSSFLKYSKNKKEAVALLEFLTSKKAQELYGEINFEYPVNPKVALSEELKSLGTFREDQLPIINIAKLAPLAQKIIDRSGW